MAIVFVPGIKGSELVDSYPLDWPLRWSLQEMSGGNSFEDSLDIGLADGLHESAADHWMRPFRAIRHTYGPLIAKLRAWQAPEPVHVFTYDWRRPLDRSALALAVFLDEVAEREQARGADPSISLVTHSMGGLVLRGALFARNPRKPFAGIGRVVFIAPPFYGSIGAPYALVVGERDGWFGTDEDYRRITRGFASVYSMTPSFAGSIVDEQEHELDLFDAHQWQANVRDGGEFQSRHLANAEAFIRGSKALHGGKSAVHMLSDHTLAAHADRVLILSGAGLPTAVRLPVLTANRHNPNWFDFAAVKLEIFGDGRVPFRSSAIAGVTLAGYTGIDDHARSCRNVRIINAVAQWLKDGRALKMTPREPRHAIQRARREWFEPWDGDPSSFTRHVI